MIDAKILTQPDFPKIERKVSKAADTGSVKLTKLGADYLRRIVPSKTGQMRDSIGHDADEIWSTSENYIYVDQGTKPHTIEADGVLTFMIGGSAIFSKYVEHPGSKAQNLTDRTVDKIDDNMSIVVDEINRVIQ